MKFILFFLVLLLLIVPVSATDWFDSDWNNRRNITINHYQVDAAMTNFPAMVSITQHGLNTDGNDIRITDSSGNQVAREIECYNATSGELVFNFNCTSISNTADTSFWMYYNNSAATEPAADSTYGSEAVWDSNYVFVHHMNTDPSGSAPQLLDSSGNEHHGTSYGAMTTGDLIDSAYGKAITLDSDDYFDLGDDDAFDGFTEQSIFARAKLNDVTNVRSIIMSKHGGVAGNRSWMMRAEYDNFHYLLVVTPDSETEHNIVDQFSSDTIYNLQQVWDGSDMEQFINGSSIGSTAKTGTMAATSQPVYIGKYTTYYLDGVIYEIRLSNTDRSDNYVATTHKNLNNPTATGTTPFYLSFGEEESYEAPPPALNGTYLYPNSICSIGCYGRLISELVYETGFNFSDIGSCNTLTAGDMEVLSVDDTNYIPSIDKDAAHDGYMYGNFSLPNVESVNFINVKTVHNRNETNPVILGLFNVSTQKWHAVNNSSVEIVDVELTYNITGTDIIKYTTLVDNTLNLSVSLNTNGDGNYDVFVDFVEVYIDYEETPDITLEYVYNLTISNQNNITTLQNNVGDLENNVDNLYTFVLLCTVFLFAIIVKRRS